MQCRDYSKIVLSDDVLVYLGASPVATRCLVGNNLLPKRQGGPREALPMGPAETSYQMKRRVFLSLE